MGLYCTIYSLQSTVCNLFYSIYVKRPTVQHEAYTDVCRIPIGLLHLVTQSGEERERLPNLEQVYASAVVPKMFFSTVQLETVTFFFDVLGSLISATALGVMYKR